MRRLTAAVAVSAVVLGAAPEPPRLTAQPAAPAVPEAAPADAWPQFRGTPALTGASRATLPASLSVKWTYEAGDAIESSAAIAGGTVYVGTGAGHLLALGLDDGRLKWKYAVELGVGESSPAVADGLVFIGDLGGVLHAVRAADGARVWTFRTLSEIKSSPVVVGDRVLIGSYDAKLYCLSARDGRLLWTLSTGNYIHATPAVAGGLVYVAGCDEVLHVIRLADGTEAATIPFGGNTGASAALAGPRAYFGTFNNEVLAVDLPGRRLAWRYRHKTRHFPFYSSAALGDGLVVVGGRDKMVHALDQSTGRERWSFQTRARVESSPLLAGGRVYVGSSDGRFYVLDQKTGRRLFDYDAGAALTASPAAAQGRIVIGSQDGRLLCFG